MHLEEHVENYFVKQVKRYGGVSVKFEVKGTSGWPDRLTFMPGGRLLLVELKRPRGGRVSMKQKMVHTMLRGLGFEVWVCRNRKEVDDAIRSGLEGSAAEDGDCVL